MSPQTVIAATALCKSVTSNGSTLDILRNVNLHIHAGESVAIVGASGSGKTTLLGLLAGLDSGSTGEVELFGKALSTLDEDHRAALRKAHIGFVFQSFLLIPTCTALENVMMALSVTGRGGRAEAEYWLERVGLSHRLHQTPRELSGGEQQRVALARAFACQPRVLFADEPTGNLDRNTGQHIIDLLFSLNRESGTTLVLVTHDDSLAALCQRRLRIDAGVLSEESAA
jgi:putative ABC transport system ATP-binding protein